MPEEQEDKNKRIRPRERAHGQKKVLAYKGTAECLVCSQKSSIKKMTCLFSISKHHNKTCTYIDIHTKKQQKTNMEIQKYAFM